MSKIPELLVPSVLTTILLSGVMPARGQIAFEHAYPEGSYSNYPGFQYANQFFLLELETGGWKYVRIDRAGRKVDFHDLDHSFWKSISFAMTTVVNSNAVGQDILYISEHLFDLDDGIEFMYVSSYSNGSDPPTGVTQVVDEETAGLIFNVNDQYPVVRPNFHLQQYPIQNTPVGTKLILSGIVNDSAYVYGLPGEMFTGMQGDASHLHASEGMKLFPNPSSTELTVLLPAGRSNASMEIITSAGMVVRTISIAGMAAMVDIQALASGRYVCRLLGEDGKLCIGSFIKN